MYSRLMLWVGVVALAAFGARGQDGDTGQADGLEPLPIKLPQPSFSGTPLDYWSEHLEPHSFRKRKPFMAAAGSSNVALKKEVTSSAEAPLMGKLEQIVDGEKGYEDAHLVELPEGLQWVQIDLGKAYLIDAILLWHFHAADRVYFDVVVKGAVDEEMEKEVTTFYNNDYDNSTKQGLGKDPEYVEDYQGRLIPGKGARARYIRLLTDGNSSNDRNHYVEVEVWGRPAADGD